VEELPISFPANQLANLVVFLMTLIAMKPMIMDIIVAVENLTPSITITNSMAHAEKWATKAVVVLITNSVQSLSVSLDASE